MRVHAVAATVRRRHGERDDLASDGIQRRCATDCFWVNSHTTAVRKLGLSVESLGEVLAIVALFNSTNALADGYQIEPDVLPPL